MRVRYSRLTAASCSHPNEIANRGPGRTVFSCRFRSRKGRFRMEAVSRFTLPLAMLSMCCSFTSAQTETKGTDTPVDSSAQQGPATQQTASGGGAGDLQKAVQNPVASLISVPVQNNSNFGIGPYDRTQDVLNIQPVIPMKLNDKWNLITRIIQPIVWQPYSSQPTGGEYGFGDMNPTFFLSPGKPG